MVCLLKLWLLFGAWKVILVILQVTYPLLQSLGTLSCEGRRQSYFRGEFFAAMRILQRGDLNESQLKGSWAGAFGHTQFMPSTYEELAVDFDGDGRRDLVSSMLRMRWHLQRTS